MFLKNDRFHRHTPRFHHLFLRLSRRGWHPEAKRLRGWEDRTRGIRRARAEIPVRRRHKTRLVCAVWHVVKTRFVWRALLDVFLWSIRVLTMRNRFYAKKCLYEMCGGVSTRCCIEIGDFHWWFSHNPNLPNRWRTAPDALCSRLASCPPLSEMNETLDDIAWLPDSKTERNTILMKTLKCHLSTHSI